MNLLGTKRSRTTAYHPQANGMVERFHRQLKAALKAQENPDAWMEMLPLILLGIRTALKEDLNATTAEMVYGTTLRLPGEFFTPSLTTTLPDPSNFINQLTIHFKNIKSVPPRSRHLNSNIPSTLSNTTHVFVRHDGLRKPLQPPYDGPYPVVKRTDKHSTVSINGHNNTVSIDRLKPAHLDFENSPSTSEHSLHSQTQHPPSTPSNPIPPLQPLSSHNTALTTPSSTRSGRHVRFPTYLSHSM